MDLRQGEAEKMKWGIFPGISILKFKVGMMPGNAARKFSGWIFERPAGEAGKQSREMQAGFSEWDLKAQGGEAHGRSRNLKPDFSRRPKKQDRV